MPGQRVHTRECCHTWKRRILPRTLQRSCGPPLWGGSFKRKEAPKESLKKKKGSEPNNEMAKAENEGEEIPDEVEGEGEESEEDTDEEDYDDDIKDEVDEDQKAAREKKLGTKDDDDYDFYSDSQSSIA